MTQRLPITALALTPWRGARLNRQQILSRLAARGWDVVYSTGPRFLWERHTPQWAAAPWLGRFEQIEGVRVDCAGRIPPRCPRCGPWDRFAIRHHAGRLRRATGAPGICYVFHPELWPYARLLGARYVVYHAYDAFDLTDDWNPQIEAYQNELATRADLVVVSAESMAHSFPEEARRRARELTNGADVQRFMEGGECPPEVSTIPHPRIGYAGAMNAKVDVKLILEVARRRPEWHWVLIGRSLLDQEQQPDFQVETARDWQVAKTYPNIHYLGPKEYEQVPAYVNHMDVNVMCYCIHGTGWWRKGYPLKLHEQLATGKPVVAAGLETIRPFSHVVDIAGTAEEWIAAIERALTAGGVGTPEERWAVALQNTWDQRIDTLEQWLFEMIASGSSRV